MPFVGQRKSSSKICLPIRSSCSKKCNAYDPSPLRFDLQKLLNKMYTEPQRQAQVHAPNYPPPL